ncbi:CpsD/CapB family tyrosine-protein kinase [Qingshengfaniella alkalisoli]|uniref:CpsD/CapB family tyrosine-protein kinase n=1 Tax=Qingshengfaniella alkalisoli TaxID=2599296 RepID=A0A5B8IW78_9RHOB|nr:CpsD/CapB family tyrosine-protein kinase [Qingshengfaniella alkalisoli]QDY69763.1 CpsD/CapB family tyrosine-protein kinase [Qingshengfaniella alkalisoli]
MERLQDAMNRARQKRSGKLREPAVKRQPRNQEISGRALPRAVSDRWAALPELAVDPKVMEANRIVTYFGRQESSPFDMMRTKIVQQARANNWRRIAVTSPTPGCGKSTLVANLAFSLARQTDIRTIVIETDMRRPMLSKLIGSTEKHVFARVLTGQDAIADHLVSYGGNVAFGTNDIPSGNSSELLQSGAAQDALRRIEKDYEPDLIIFDTSPLMVSDDTIGFLEHVDATVLVAAAETTSVEQVDVAEAEIAEVTQVLGVVLNKCRYSSGGYGYDYGYY